MTMLILTLRLLVSLQSNLAPETEIREALTFYYQLGIPDTKIEIHMKEHYDTNTYGLGYVLVPKFLGEI